MLLPDYILSRIPAVFLPPAESQVRNLTAQWQRFSALGVAVPVEWSWPRYNTTVASSPDATLVPASPAAVPACL